MRVPSVVEPMYHGGEPTVANVDSHAAARGQIAPSRRKPSDRCRVGATLLDHLGDLSASVFDAVEYKIGTVINYLECVSYPREGRVAC